MRTLLFAVCFSVGVTLMIVSGYLPRPATADNRPESRGIVLVSDRVAREARRALRSMEYRSAPTIVAAEQITVRSGFDPDETDDEVEDDPPADTPIDFAPEADPAADGPESDLPATPRNYGASQADDEAWSGLAEDEATPPAPDAGEPELQDDSPARSASSPDTPDVDEPSTPEPDTPLPRASAGEDRVAWAGWDDLPLDAGGSTGAGLAYEWKQTAGPRRLELDDAGAARTVARGLLAAGVMSWSPELYRFEVTVTDEFGRVATDEVDVVVLYAPELTVVPAAQRGFRERDGYWLGHYEAVSVQDGPEDAVFQVRSPTALTFTRISGGAYDVARLPDAGDEYQYELVVYRDGDAETVVELLVDTDEGVPGVLRLVVRQ